MAEQQGHRGGGLQLLDMRTVPRRGIFALVRTGHFASEPRRVSGVRGANR